MRLWGGFEYPHMCRMDHDEIGHRDPENEQCPLCRANDEIDFKDAEITRLRKALLHTFREATLGHNLWTSECFRCCSDESLIETLCRLAEEEGE
jgi:hypothetical protein